MAGEGKDWGGEADSIREVLYHSKGQKGELGITSNATVGHSLEPASGHLVGAYSEAGQSPGVHRPARQRGRGLLFSILPFNFFKFPQIMFWGKENREFTLLLRTS